MRSHLFLLCVPLLGAVLLLSQSARAASSWDGKTPVDYVLSVETDRKDAIYRQGETVTFNVELQQNQKPADAEEIEWTISKDGVAPIQTGKLTLKAGRGVVTGSLKEPGFLQCKVNFKGAKPAISALAAGGIDLAAIKPSMPAPADFDAFWAAQKKRLAAVPMNTKLTSVPPPANRDGAETFSFVVDSIGAPSTGFYGRPIGAKPKSLPAVLFVPGAGVRSANLDSMAGWAKAGMIVAEINAHGIANGETREYYGALDVGELSDYRKRGRESRDTFYFQGVYFRVLRALQFLTEQPEWDGKTLIILGGSQGGGLSLAGAALDQRVTFIVSNVPGLTDHTGMVAGRIAGWPKAIPVGADGKPDAKVLEAMRYYDGVNFAARIKIPVHMEVGFIDIICPPTASYAAYNNLGGKKEMITWPDRGHDIGPQIWNDMRKLVLAHTAEMHAK
ncbi:acetylxylan esterase [Rariglobus hedericola]|nr:acetylxylan esterase [Rariglobus hedericola]